VTGNESSIIAVLPYCLIAELPHWIHLPEALPALLPW